MDLLYYLFEGGSEIKFLTPLETFFQSLVALYAMLSKTKFSFWDFYIKICENILDCKHFVSVWK